MLALQSCRLFAECSWWHICFPLSVLEEKVLEENVVMSACRDNGVR